MKTNRVGIAASGLVLVAQLVTTAVSPVAAVDQVTETFGFTGTEQVFTVPAGVTSIHVVLTGAPGGNGGGRGARVEGDVAVTSGAQLYVEVGGPGAGPTLGSSPGGFNGGGAGGASATGFWSASGGGASDIRTVPRDQAGSLASRVVVAGGGGGASAESFGGSAGNPGGGTIAGGGAGTATAGGSGGSSGGQAGGLGVGGTGGTGDFQGGGGGGGGLYGGGGGGYLAGSNPIAGGGGGGSSFTGSAANPSVGLDDARTPSVTITYAAITDSGTVTAQVTVPTSAACLELSTSSVDFGTLSLGAEDQPGSPAVTVTNCSGVSETILARGTDASGAGATWTLDDSADACAGSLGTDAYHLDLAAATSSVRLSTTNKLLGTLGSGSTADHTARISTACPGSSGGGTTMTMQIVFVATE